MTKIKEAVKFGTFGGVFAPCVLTILGVIMFLRFGQVVGESGLYYALGIILAAKLITVLTTFSLSAVATNTRIEGGGAYFLISRSLGAEFGGVIGIVLFIAQAVSVAMYVIGFTEAFAATFPELGYSFTSIATVVNLFTFICVFIGAGWTIKLQYGILAVLGLSLIAFFAGAVPDFSLVTLAENSGPSFSPKESAFTMFALFFPAVTGIMAGANMSGDLKDPSKSIPQGTLAAIAVTSVVYILMAIVLAGSASREALINDSLIVKTLSISPILIIAGVFAATISSALGSMMGAPRILQAFGKDNIFKSARFFAKGSGKSQEPRRAIVLTFLIAQAGIVLGDLNALAPVITMFFMITYGTLNLACFYEGITKNPSYRPLFKYNHWSLSLIGAIGCIVVMLLINFVWAILSILIIGLLFFIISRIEIKARWGDVGSGVAFERARKALLKLEDEYYHPKNWRPAIMALSGGAWSRFHLAEYAHWLAAGHGILTLAQLMPEVTENPISRRADAERRLRTFIHQESLSAFPVVVIENKLEKGMQSLLQSHGIGGMRPNTVLMGMPRSQDRWDEFYPALRVAKNYERSLVLIDCVEDTVHWEARKGHIDLLWQGRKHGELIILFGHLLKKNPQWRSRRLRILAALPPKGDAEKLKAELMELLTLSRIDATVHVFNGEDLFVVLAKRTGNSAVLFTQFEPPEPEEEASFLEWTEKLTKLVPDIIYVHSNGNVSLNA